MERMLRVNELLKRELGVLFERLICPEVNGLVTVTDVHTATDLRQATVYVSVYGPGISGADVLDLLAKHRRMMQREIAQAVRLKYTPKLSFRLDDELDKADRVWQLLADLEADGADDAGRD
jgi:ribosome-binding factor A